MPQADMFIHLAVSSVLGELLPLPVWSTTLVTEIEFQVPKEVKNTSQHAFSMLTSRDLVMSFIFDVVVMHVLLNGQPKGLNSSYRI